MWQDMLGPLIQLLKKAHLRSRVVLSSVFPPNFCMTCSEQKKLKILINKAFPGACRCSVKHTPVTCISKLQNGTGTNTSSSSCRVQLPVLQPCMRRARTYLLKDLYDSVVPFLWLGTWLNWRCSKTKFLNFRKWEALLLYFQYRHYYLLVFYGNSVLLI